MFDEVGMEALRAKSVRLTRYLEELVKSELVDDVEVLTPHEAVLRGCQLSLRFRGGNGRNLFEAISARGVVCDWREPDVIRAAAAPLYNGFEDVHRFVATLKEALVAP